MEFFGILSGGHAHEPAAVLADLLRIAPPITPEDLMDSQNYDDWTIERWRLEPRISGLEWEDSKRAEQAPPLWKDLTMASVLAAILWLAAAAIFG